MPIKVTDPDKMVTDPVLLMVLAEQGVDKDYVEFFQDYAPSSLGKEHSPYAKFYRDLNSNKRFMVVSGLPMVDADGVKIEVGWRVAGINYFSEKNNLFRARVQGTDVELMVRNDQPDGRKANDRLSYRPQLFLNGVGQLPAQSVLLSIDPVNSNYQENTIEWDYGICKRRLRIIEGSILGSWVFAQKPSGEVRIRYNQVGDYKLRLGQFKITDDEELIRPEDFDELALMGGYPVTVSDSATFYSDPTTSVDGFVTNQGTVWATVHNATSGSAVDYTGTFFYILCRWYSPNYRIDRAPVLFPTATLPDTATITAATLSINSAGREGTSGRSYNVYSSSPGSNTILAVEDFDAIGVIAFSTAVTQVAWPALGVYVNFILNSSGIANISTTDVSKFSLREVIKDVGNVAPTDNIYADGYAAEQGSGYKPKLVVTYTAGTAWTKNLADTVTLNDSTVKAPVKQPTDTLSLIDSFARQLDYFRTLTDTLGLADSVVKTMSLTKADTLILTDSPVKGLGKKPTDTLILADSFSRIVEYYRTLTDTTTLTDAPVKAVGLNKSDTLTLADVIDTIRGRTKALADSITLADAYHFNRILSILAMSFSHPLQVVSSISQPLNLTPSFSRGLMITTSIASLYNISSSFSEGLTITSTLEGDEDGL